MVEHPRQLVVTVQQFKFIMTPLANDHFRAITSQSALDTFAAEWVDRCCLPSKAVLRSVARELNHVKRRVAARQAKHMAGTWCWKRQAIVSGAVTHAETM